MPLVVFFVESLFGALFVVKDFDDFLTVEHFLDVAVDAGERSLLADEVERAAVGNLEGDDDDHGGDGGDDEGEHPAVIEHDAEGGDDGDDASEHLRQCLRDELAQRIGVVGVVAHDVAVGVHIEVADGEGLHVIEHIVPNVFEAALGNKDHEAAVSEGAQYAREVEGAHQAEDASESRENGICLFEEGRYVVIHEDLDEDGAAHVGEGRDEYAHDGNGEDAFVVYDNIIHEPFDGFAAETFLFGISHCPFLLFAVIRTLRGRCRWIARAARVCRRRRFFRR